MPRIPVSFRLHRQLGIWLGTFLLIMAVTGCLLVFRPELSRALYPAVFASGGCEPRLPLSEVASTAAAVVPEMTLMYVEDMQVPCVNAFAVAIPLNPQAENAPVMLGLDLATGEVAGRMPLAHNVLNLALAIHTELLAGDGGRWTVGALGAILATVTVSGILVWVRGQSRRLRSHLERTYRIRSRFFAYDAHRATGVSAAILLLLMAITGASMAFEKELQPLISRLALAPPKPAAAALIAGDAAVGTLDIPQALALTERLLPDARPAVAGFAGERGELVYVSGRAAGDNFGYGRITVFLDRRNGLPLAVIDSRTDPVSWFVALEAAWTLHAGTALGIPGRVLSLLAGLSMTALFLLAVRVWWNRRRARLPRAAGTGCQR